MSIEKCKNCGVIITRDEGHPNLWIHRPTQNAPACLTGEPGMGLLETIQVHWKNPLQYATWARKVYDDAPDYTPNAILHGLQMQATIHWNICNDNICNCESIGKSTADGYMLQLANGRHDLHPHDDQDVHMLAFEIHNKSGHGRPGVMTCTYVVGAGSSNACECYELGYREWLQKKSQEAEMKVITPTPFDPDDAWYEPRFV